jgi:hypothetical protein
MADSDFVKQICENNTILQDPNLKHLTILHTRTIRDDLRWMQSLIGSNIRVLYIVSCSINCEFLIELAAVLPKTKIHFLVIHHNDIGDRGVDALIAVLPKTNLDMLNIRVNDISYGAHKRLIAAMPTCKLWNLITGFDEDNYLNCAGLDEYSNACASTIYEPNYKKSMIRLINTTD